MNFALTETDGAVTGELAKATFDGTVSESADARGNKQRRNLMRKRFNPTEEYFSSRPINAKLLQIATLIQRSASIEYGERFGLNWLECNIVAVVGRTGGLTMGALAANISRQPSQVSRAVNSLVKRKIVGRITGEVDRRELRVVLTRLGERIRDEIETLAKARAEQLTDGLSRDGLQVTETAFTKIRRNALTMLEKREPGTKQRD